MNNALLSALSLCRKAGKLIHGFDAAAEAIRKGAPLALILSDASDRTGRKFKELCGKTPVLEADADSAEAESATGKRFVVAAVSDENLAKLITTAANKGGSI